MFTDPLAVTYDGSAKSLPRISSAKNSTRYRTADGEFEVLISSYSPPRGVEAAITSQIELVRRLPDPTPGNVFDDYRMVRNAFGLTYTLDLSRAEASVDIPRLRTALLALVDSSFQTRLMGGEK